MAEKRQSSLRFRLPWLRPTPAPRRPPAQSTEKTPSRRSQASHQPVSPPTRTSPQHQEKTFQLSSTEHTSSESEEEPKPDKSQELRPAPENAPTQMHPTVALDAGKKQLEEEEIIGKEDPTVSESGLKPMHKEGNKQNDSLNERPVNFITLAGENRGASIQLGSESARGEGTVHIHRSYKSNSEGRMSPDSKSYINSNVQGINNSIMFNSSITERDPGIRLEPSNPNSSMESIEEDA